MLRSGAKGVWSVERVGLHFHMSSETVRIAGVYFCL